MDAINCAVCMFDTRSFTDNLRYFDQLKDNTFIQLIQNLCQNGLILASIIEKENNFFFNPAGDGFILIFFGENASVKCYLHSLLLKEMNNKICNVFKKEKGKEIHFGMGLECGTVVKIEMKKDDKAFVTYIGDAINNAARMESETKHYFSDEIMVGSKINNDIVQKIYDFDYSNIYDNVVKKLEEDDNSTEIAEYLIKFNEINHNMLLTFLSQHKLKGIDQSASCFRVSSSLSKAGSREFERCIEMLSKYLKLKSEQMLNQIK